ncbi:hypothetical protein R4P70_29880 [Rhodococcus sp. IEGM 1241]|nr:hypothetical protein [Rhodococcus sp. IEGM 1241]MDV8015534.1 hypothetical protein [Rhodococcus sp. IEGM 1241]
MQAPLQYVICVPETAAEVRQSKTFDATTVLKRGAKGKGVAGI